MTLYLVLYENNYYHDEFVGVFSTREKAEEYVSTRVDMFGRSTSKDYIIDEIIVDKTY